jgi:hypothetical protein
MRHTYIPLPQGKVLSIIFDSRRDLTLAMARVEEFYEGPKVKGQHLSWAKWLMAYTSPEGKIDYFEKWSGFNIPREVFVKWYSNVEISGYDDFPENLMIDIATDIVPWNYLIATDSTSDDPTAFAHEMAHARWALDPEYRKETRRKLRQIELRHYRQMCAGLLADGYPDDEAIFEDEVQAYLSTGEMTELQDVFPLVPLLELSKYRRLFQQ